MAIFELDNGRTRRGGDAAALASLAGDPLADRFCAWRGSSEQRYVASIYPVEVTSSDAGLPAFEGCLVMAVGRDQGRRRILFVDAIERASDRIRAVARGHAVHADEWHVHFLAETPEARRAAVADLARRHASVETVGRQVA